MKASTRGSVASPRTKNASSPNKPLWNDFKLKHGPVGVVLADALPRFSLDVVGVVYQYLQTGPAEAARTSLACRVAYKSAEFSLNYCSIACSPDGLLWIADKHGVQQFDISGGLVRRLDTLKGSTGIAFSGGEDPEAFIVTQAGPKHRAVVMDLKGAVRRKIDVPEHYPTYCDVLRPLCISSNGNIFVLGRFSTQHDDHLVLVVDKSGKRVREFQQQNPLEEGSPRAIAYAPLQREVLIADKDSGAKVFNESGTLLRKLTQFGAVDVAVDSKGNIYVAEDWSVQVFASNGALITTFGQKDKRKTKIFFPAALRSVAVGNDGYMFLCDRNARVSVYAFL